MKRILLVCLAVVLLVLGVRAVFRALASDETKIRWQIETMEAGYCEGDVGDTIGPLAQDWRHERYPIATRENVRQGLIGRFFQGRHPRTKELLHRVEVDYDTLVVDVQGDRAVHEVELTFLELRKDGWQVNWRLRTQGEWRHGPNGWFLHASSHEDVQGTMASL